MIICTRKEELWQTSKVGKLYAIACMASHHGRAVEETAQCAHAHIIDLLINMRMRILLLIAWSERIYLQSSENCRCARSTRVSSNGVILSRYKL